MTTTRTTTLVPRQRKQISLRRLVGAQFVTAGTICLIVHFGQFMAGGGALHILLTSMAAMELGFGLLWPYIGEKK